jgi:pentatricopeptide repeat protein
VNEAQSYFDSMKTQFNIEPTNQHYNCMVDVLARSGQLDKAEYLISSMEQQDIISWTALLGSCRTHGDVKRAERIADIILKLNPQDAPTYVLLSNIYASVGRFDDVKRVRTLMEKNGVKKIPGMTWIEVDGEIHSFVVHDKSHKNTDEIYEKLEWLISEMKKVGYIPDTSFILHDVEEEDKKELICYHSEKLAISFGLLKLPPHSNIIITKNLRVCGDCHTSTKLISKICKRDIIVRDSNRFHHFKDGKCSCNDYY